MCVSLYIYIYIYVRPFWPRGHSGSVPAAAGRPAMTKKRKAGA